LQINKSTDALRSKDTFILYAIYALQKKHNVQLANINKITHKAFSTELNVIQ